MPDRASLGWYFTRLTKQLVDGVILAVLPERADSLPQGVDLVRMELCFVAPSIPIREDQGKRRRSKCFKDNDSSLRSGLWSWGTTKRITHH